MSFIRIALKNLLRRRLRTALTLCGVGVGIAAFVALVGFSRSFEDQWAKLYESSGTDIAVVQKTFLNTFVDESVGEKLRSLPFVAAADPVIVNLMDLTPEVNALVYGWPANSFEMDTLTLLQGRRFHDDQSEVMLGEVLAENLGKKPGCGSCRSCPTSEAKSRLSMCTCARARRESPTSSTCKRLAPRLKQHSPA